MAEAWLPSFSAFYEYEDRATRREMRVYGKQDRFSLWYYALGLAGEAGEVADKVKKVYRDHLVSRESEIRDLPPEVLGAVVLELGDALWYLAATARKLGYTLEDVARMNDQKLDDREARGVLKGSGDKR